MVPQNVIARPFRIKRKAQQSRLTPVRPELVEGPSAHGSIRSLRNAANYPEVKRGLYVHVPFCVRKCNYCDFYSVPNRLESWKAYVDAVLSESTAYAGMSFQSMYFGGGTPSVLGGELFGELLKGLNKTLVLTGIDEATVEVNPDSASREFLTAAKKSGINRVSVGVQSLNDCELHAAGRIHTASQAVAAVKLAKELGFTGVSADLIVGLPGQSWPSLKRSLDELVKCGIHHISLYCLTLEEDTPFSKNPPDNLPGEDVQTELFERARELLRGGHFVHYEISNFALNGFECRHNLNYWHGGEYVGLGPAAASHLGGKRFRNRSDLYSYLKNPCGAAEGIEELAPKTKAAEEAMLRLRLLTEGIDINEMTVRFGDDNVKSLRERLNRMASAEKLVVHGTRFLLPSSRVLTSNPIFAEVLV